MSEKMPQLTADQPAIRVTDPADVADSGLEDELVSSSGDLRSLCDLDLEDTGQGLLEVPVYNSVVSSQLRQFLRSARSPQTRRRAGDAEARSTPEVRADGSGELEYDWWEGLFSFRGTAFGETDLYSWYLDTHEKVQVLERQVTVLAENQNNTDDRYTRSKEENATLQARLIMMEEQLRDAEMRAEEQLDSEKRRHRELMQRLEREKLLEVENHQIRSLSLEKELRFAEAEADRCRQQLRGSADERAALDERLVELQAALDEAREQTRRAVDLERRACSELESQRSAQAQMMAELSRELEETQRTASLRLKTESDESGLIRLQHSELEAELRQLRQENKELQESNEELQAQLLTTGLHEGMQLLNSGTKSLAAELGDMSGDQVDSAENSQKLKKSLLEQQEVNQQLRAYIDGILLNIVENYPQLLEVKRKH
ncbi:rab11 family-interacting protein 4B-like isoform X3 [Pollicipes pollicipes]|uniref:rab11 family-interacting protein 4B-like isoform X3 n=1 Tax=Pollicipes pollicipes TaxID=41117 RepID=UPI001884B358|nr:rab11 family-interacting protein 4B-like isoform X3 [Pollicipes pollicipes]